GEGAGALRELGDLLGGGDAAPVGGQAGAEDVGDEDDLGLLADGAGLLGLPAGVLGGSHQLGVGVAHLVLGEATPPVLGHHVATREAVVDGSQRRLGGPTDGLTAERRRRHWRRG
ncbi:hypothetical protein B7486_74320, partial [cyanobacterium TDX16]